MRVWLMRSRASSASSGGSATAVSWMISVAVPPAPNRIIGPEQAILIDANQKLMRMGAHDHGLHGEALQTRLGTKLTRMRHASVGGHDERLVPSASRA